MTLVESKFEFCNENVDLEVSSDADFAFWGPEISKLGRNRVPFRLQIFKFYNLIDYRISLSTRNFFHRLILRWRVVELSPQPVVELSPQPGPDTVNYLKQ